MNIQHLKSSVEAFVDDTKILYKEFAVVVVVSAVVVAVVVVAVAAVVVAAVVVVVVAVVVFDKDKSKQMKSNPRTGCSKTSHIYSRPAVA